MNACKKIMLLCLMVLPIGQILSQESLAIEKIFNMYGKKRGAVLIELSTDVLEGHTRISFYKSMITELSDFAQQEVIQAINDDMQGGKKVMETVKDGEVESGYYYLKREPYAPLHEYILYKVKGKTVTLIYIQCDFVPSELKRELDKLKDLFIYVNDKRIKLQ